MKKIIFFLVLAILILFSISKLYYSPEKRMLKGFAQDVINENIKIEKIIDKYIICDKRAIEIDILVLKRFRSEYKKHPNTISVYTYHFFYLSNVVKWFNCNHFYVFKLLLLIYIRNVKKWFKVDGIIPL